MNNRCIIDSKPNCVEHHILPKSLGGKDTPENKVWLCAECHSNVHNSGATHWIEYLMELKDKREHGRQ
jgi:5-methylcytosine-specific restriction endonuclease McrA